MMSHLDVIQKFKYKIALPAPALYGQFDNLDDVDYVLNGLKKIGFDDVFEVSKAAELVSAYTRQYIKTEGVRMPVISPSCPVIVRLIGLMFPLLKENIMHLKTPMEVAAMMARERAEKAHPELDPKDIGVFFISPCPAKNSFVINAPDEDGNGTGVDAVLAINDLYFELINAMKRDEKLENLADSGMIGIGWATSGGESAAILNDDYLAAFGIENVIRVLHQIENGNIPQVKFIELNACPGGCVGGVLTVQNPFIANTRLQSLRRYLPVSLNRPKEEGYIPEEFFFEELPTFNPLGKLSSNMAESMRMMADIQRIRKSLPGIDCGACGAPSCRAHAEDAVVSGNTAVDCPILKAWSMKEQE